MTIGQDIAKTRQAVRFRVSRCERQDVPTGPAAYAQPVDVERFLPIDLTAGMAPAVPRLKVRARLDDVHYCWQWRQIVAHDDMLELCTEHSDAAKRVCLFAGFVVEVDWTFDAQANDLAVIAVGRSFRLDRDVLIYGRYMKGLDGTIRLYSGLPCDFNAGGAPNKHPSAVTEGLAVPSIPAFTYDGDPAAAFWKAADIFKYLMWRYNAAQIWIANETWAVARQIESNEFPVAVNVEQLSLWQALAAVGDASGNDVWEEFYNNGGRPASRIAIQGRSKGPLRTIKHQAPGPDGAPLPVDPDRTELFSARCAESVASCAPCPTVFGAARFYELTFPLQKAWNLLYTPGWAFGVAGAVPATDGEDPGSDYLRMYVVGGAEFLPEACRLWDANVDGLYTVRGLDVPDVGLLATQAEAADPESWPVMPFDCHPLLTTVDLAGLASPRAWVDIQFPGGQSQPLLEGWQIVPGRVGILLTKRDLATIVPAGSDKYTANYMQSLIDAPANLRMWLTLTVRGPHRTIARRERQPLAGTSFSQTAAISRSALGRYERSGEDAAWDFLGPQHHDVDERAELDKALQKIQAVTQYRAIEAALEIPWPDNAWSLGDRMQRISGIEYSLTSNSGQANVYPRVVGLTMHLGVSDYNLQLTLDTDRMAGRI